MPELIIGGILAALGIRSLVRWMRTEFESESFRDQVLFLLHAGSRVGLWFALAGFFFGFALVEEIGPFVRWYLFVPIGLAGLQLMTGVLLGRSPLSRSGGDDEEARTTGRRVKAEAAEVERAQLLANQAWDELRRAGLADRDIRRLADEYIALDRGEDLGAFIGWAKKQARA